MPSPFVAPDGGDQTDENYNVRRPDGSFDLEATLQVSRDRLNKYTRDVGASDPKRPAFTPPPAHP